MAAARQHIRPGSFAPPEFEDRPYQDQALVDLRATGMDSVILYAPTGSGKTAVMCNITNRAVAKGRSVLFMGDSIEIVEQTSATMDWWRVKHGIIQGSNKRDRRPWELVHIATIQTLRNRTLPKKDIVFVDECHLARAATWETVIQHYIDAGAKIIGASATPCRLDGRGLGKLFKHIVCCPSIEELTEQGYLVPFWIFKPPSPKLAGVPTEEGDWQKRGLAAVMDKPKLIGDAVAHYGTRARGRLAILAAVGIEHSKHLAAAFRAAGIPAAHADATTDREERKRVLSMPAPGVICQVDICGKGWDRPEVSAVIDCRPTQSLARWLQFVGRGVRPFEFKETCVLLDHSGNVIRFGMPDAAREWTLDETQCQPRATAGDPALAITTCRKCFGTFRSIVDVCPYCGAPVVRQVRRIEVEPGQLEEMRRDAKERAIENWREKVSENAEGISDEEKQARIDEKKRRYKEWQAIAAERKYKPMWPQIKFKTTFGHWPGREVRA